VLGLKEKVTVPSASKNPANQALFFVSGSGLIGIIPSF
jgi:hypothetical protein